MTYQLNIKGIWEDTIQVEAPSMHSAFVMAEDYIKEQFVATDKNYAYHEVVFSPTGDTFKTSYTRNPPVVKDWKFSADGIPECEICETNLYAMGVGDTLTCKYPTPGKAELAMNKAMRIGEQQGREFDCELSGSGKSSRLTIRRIS